jgi:hypothetical protein
MRMQEDKNYTNSTILFRIHRKEDDICGAKLGQYGVRMSISKDAMRIRGGGGGNRVFCLVAPILLMEKDSEREFKETAMFFIGEKVGNFRVYIERSGVKLQNNCIQQDIHCWREFWSSLN